MSNQIQLSLLLAIKKNTVLWERDDDGENGFKIISEKEEWIEDLESKETIELFSNIEPWLKREKENQLSFPEWSNKWNIELIDEIHTNGSPNKRYHELISVYGSDDASELKKAKANFTEMHKFGESYLFHQFDWTYKYRQVGTILGTFKKVTEGEIISPSSVWLIPKSWV